MPPVWEKARGWLPKTYLTHATPAAFGAHEPGRDNYSEIAVDYLIRSRPDVMMGGGENGLSVSAAAGAGYATATNAEELSAHANETLPFAGLFGSTHIPYEYDGTGLLPGLTDMVSANDLTRMVYETIEFSDAIELAVEWAERREDTLIVVTADHETGGLAVLSSNGAGAMPEITWAATAHTGIDVPLHASGPGADHFRDTIENTRIHDVLRTLIAG